MKKIIIIGFSALLVIVVTTLVIIKENDMDNDIDPRESLTKFSNLIENGDIYDISLEIYYIDPYIESYAPISVSDLINMRDWERTKFTISGDKLKEQIDSLNKISSLVLVPVETKYPVDARVYYIFKYKNRKIFDIAMWGEGRCIFVNGVAFKENTIFYDIIVPFLSDKEAGDFKTYVRRAYS